MVDLLEKRFEVVKMVEQVYVDNSATTFMDYEILDIYTESIKKYYGNPSSLHQLGVESENLLKKAKSIIAQTLKVKPEEILFTSGGTESNNLAIHGSINSYSNRGNKIITTKIEHPSVLEVFKYYQKKGYDVVFLDVDNSGFIKLEQLEKELDKNTILVSVMAVNNEIGTLQDIEAIGGLIKKVNPRCIYHVDAIQGYGKVNIDVKKSLIDLLSLSSHKIHGPKGVGALYIKDKITLSPVMLGGGQQAGIRSGTENVPGYYAMAKACEKAFEEAASCNRVLSYTQRVGKEIARKIKNVKILTPEKSAPHIITLAFKGLKGEVLVHSLESKGIYLSTGSACSAKHQGVSHVLTAIDLPKEYQEGAIRISFSRYNNDEEIDYLVKSIIESVEELNLFMG